MTYSKCFDEALIYASDLHRNQRRKGKDVPYVTHLLGVASLVGANGGDEDQVIAALLHDAIEDDDDPNKIRCEIREYFGERVFKIVDDCTDADDHSAVAWSTRKKRYLAHLAELPDEAPAVLVSLADKVHNSRAILRDLRTEEEIFWERFTAGREQILWYYKRLADTFSAKRSGWLASELERAVGGIESEIRR